MNKLLIASLTAGLLSVTLSSHAQTLVATSNILVRALDRSLDFTSDTTTSIRDMKVLLEARDEAAGFVASEGGIRGVRLEAAFDSLCRQSSEARAASDLELAEAILAL
ncbi:hypothetical protein DNJ95_10135 [Stutzerimonas kirkiae]|uniref:DUF2388 domain-containing protein n=1 Tax=Stutzerimonas kirkiae TaxID=2211392 RepID=A0A4Q9R7J4_9GAMM|nr:DUF2388 domain-containing protein [Stutzerimonas kirkiae]TBU96543.1 hypothetical protein DNJ96_10385 [Stutzerimonas kirkiae]TBV02173.1 hypothetical protein DNJ95_10135 [Stutzerimonas kirkiae]